MPRLIGIVVSVGLADSLNPTTLGPALYMASLPGGIRRVLLFTAGVFAVNFVAGVAITVGPGHLLLALVPHPRGAVRHAIEVVAGVALRGSGVALWIGRRRLARRPLPGRGSGGRAGGRGALVAGLSIAALELPTAAPYFAVMAAVAASSASLIQQIGLLAAYNVAFVLPLLAIWVVLALAGQRGDRVLRAAGAWLQRRWPVVLAGLLLFVGGALAIAGGVGLLKD
jgi:cytochrome c biogenesis protein CcdA